MVNDYLMGLLFKGGDMGARIKSVQRGVIELDGVTSNTQEINEVDMSKSLCILLGFRSVAIQPRDSFCSVALATSTTIEAVRRGNTGLTSASWMLIEFREGISSLQRGFFAIAEGELTADHTITEIDTNKYILVLNGTISYESSNEERLCITLELINSTTLRATRGAAGLTLTVSFELIEFLPSV